MTEGAGEVSLTSESVVSSYGHYTDNTRSIAAAIEQLSINAGIIAASVEEMTSTINEIADNSTNAQRIAQNTVLLPHLIFPASTFFEKKEKLSLTSTGNNNKTEATLS